MCALSNPTKPNRHRSISSQNTDVGENDPRFARIKEANRKIKLIDILNSYNIKVIRQPGSNWSQSITCPFPSHKNANERSPSFGYCFKSDHFNCLGCGSSGRAVEFLSLKQEVTRTSVAESILARFSEDSLPEDYIHQDNLMPSLLEMSSYLNKAVRKYKDNPKILKALDGLFWWVDFYLMAKAPSNSVTKEELERRFDRVKEIINEFEVSDCR